MPYGHHHSSSQKAWKGDVKDWHRKSHVDPDDLNTGKKDLPVFQFY